MEKKQMWQQFKYYFTAHAHIGINLMRAYVSTNELPQSIQEKKKQTNIHQH